MEYLSFWIFYDISTNIQQCFILTSIDSDNNTIHSSATYHS